MAENRLSPDERRDIRGFPHLTLLMRANACSLGAIIPRGGCAIPFM